MQNSNAENVQFMAELAAGAPSDTFGTNPHFSYPKLYEEFGRRFVPLYPYTEKKNQNRHDQEIIPVRATPEQVLAAALQSAIEQADRSEDSDTEDAQKTMLRSGDFWDAVWVEEGKPQPDLRSRDKVKNRGLKEYENDNFQKLNSVRAKISPGSKLHNLAKILKKMSPELVYVINKD